MGGYLKSMYTSLMFFRIIPVTLKGLDFVNNRALSTFLDSRELQLAAQVQDVLPARTDPCVLVSLTPLSSFSWSAISASSLTPNPVFLS